jgi:hypothetical protein
VATNYLKTKLESTAGYASVTEIAIDYLWALLFVLTLVANAICHARQLADGRSGDCLCLADPS